MFLDELDKLDHVMAVDSPANQWARFNGRNSTTRKRTSEKSVDARRQRKDDNARRMEELMKQGKN